MNIQESRKLVCVECGRDVAEHEGALSYSTTLIILCFECYWKIRGKDRMEEMKAEVEKHDNLPNR